MNYDVSLFSLELGGAWTYHGIVKIALKVISPMGELVLNSKEIEVKSAEISDLKGIFRSNARSERITYRQTTGFVLTRMFIRHPLVEGIKYFLRQELGTSGLSVSGRDHACRLDPYHFFHRSDE